MGAGAASMTRDTIEAAGKPELMAAYDSMEPDDRKAFWKAFKHGGLEAAIEGSGDDTKAAFAEISEEDRMALGDALEAKAKDRRHERGTKRIQRRIEKLEEIQEKCEDEEKRGQLSERIEHWKAKLLDAQELGPTDRPPREERKAALEAKHEDNQAKISEAEEGGKDKKAKRLRKRNDKMKKWIDQFDDDSSCPSDCSSCQYGSPSDCSDVYCSDGDEE